MDEAIEGLVVENVAERSSSRLSREGFGVTAIVDGGNMRKRLVTVQARSRD
jgi:hypothetical protein